MISLEDLKKLGDTLAETSVSLANDAEDALRSGDSTMAGACVQAGAVASTGAVVVVHLRTIVQRLDLLAAVAKMAAADEPDRCSFPYCNNPAAPGEFFCSDCEEA